MPGQLAKVTRAAVKRLADAGLPAEQLQQLLSVEIVIGNLREGRLGLAQIDGITGDRITIDADAAGYGWFVDRTPMRDNEFREVSEHELEAKRRNVAKRMDLLTVVLHEMGHVLGFDHHDEYGVMQETLGTGTRRLFEQDFWAAFEGGVESAGPATALPPSAVDKIMADDDDEERDQVVMLF